MDSTDLSAISIKKVLESFFIEDDLSRNFTYIKKLPNNMVDCRLKFKSDMTVAGLNYFFESFNYLLKKRRDFSEFLDFEGNSVLATEKKEITFELPFGVAITAERIALNLLQHASSIATFTNEFVQKAKSKNIKILDTRKTLPGLRAIEKYAVTVGGGFNHRYGQSDMWMIKDNHKTFFGGLKEAYDFFLSLNQFYTPILSEIHSLEELRQAIELNIKHVMLDNFSPEQIHAAVKIKPSNMTYEVSGGIRLHNIEDYLIEGIDAISIGALTYAAPQVDVSMKIGKK